MEVKKNKGKDSRIELFYWHVTGKTVAVTETASWKEKTRIDLKVESRKMVKWWGWIEG